MFSQQRSLKKLLTDSLMTHASVSVSIIDGTDGSTIMDYNSEKSLVPASIMKLVTTACALEVLGPSHTFKTSLAYTGSIDKNTGTLDGNIVITGGGDPSLGSEVFKEYYKGFPDNWISGISALGIRRITGRVISDDSYFDFEPVPPKWMWEDLGNYYGAGAYGLSIYDNTYRIHINTLKNSKLPGVTGIFPPEASADLTNRLTVNSGSDSGYVFSAPYGNSGWISGSIPGNEPDFVLKVSVNDPPLLAAKLLTSRLMAAGITVEGEPSTIRTLRDTTLGERVVILLTTSPSLDRLIEQLNHESVNLYAEHLVKEIGKVFEKTGSTVAGIDFINKYLADSVGITPGGIIMNDGSGLSPADRIDSKDLTALLFYMKHRGRYFNEFYSSLPEGGKNGTLRSWFMEPVFRSTLRAKSGSMTRVRSYAGYLTAKSGKELIFSIIINNYNGPSQGAVTAIEDILREAAVQN